MGIETSRTHVSTGGPNVVVNDAAKPDAEPAGAQKHTGNVDLAAQAAPEPPVASKKAAPAPQFRADIIEALRKRGHDVELPAAGASKNDVRELSEAIGKIIIEGGLRSGFANLIEPSMIRIVAKAERAEQKAERRAAEARLTKKDRDASAAGAALMLTGGPIGFLVGAMAQPQLPIVNTRRVARENAVYRLKMVAGEILRGEPPEGERAKLLGLPLSLVKVELRRAGINI